MTQLKIPHAIIKTQHRQINRLKKKKSRKLSCCDRRPVGGYLVFTFAGDWAGGTVRWRSGVKLASEAWQCSISQAGWLFHELYVLSSSRTHFVHLTTYILLQFERGNSTQCTYNGSYTQCHRLAPALSPHLILHAPCSSCFSTPAFSFPLKHAAFYPLLHFIFFKVSIAFEIILFDYLYPAFLS